MHIPQDVISISVYDATIMSQRERNALTCFNEKARSKMSKWKLSLSNNLPASPYFSNYDDQNLKPNNFEMAALDNSHKLHGFCI